MVERWDLYKEKFPFFFFSFFSLFCFIFGWWWWVCFLGDLTKEQNIGYKIIWEIRFLASMLKSIRLVLLLFFVVFCFFVCLFLFFYGGKLCPFWRQKIDPVFFSFFFFLSFCSVCDCISWKGVVYEKQTPTFGLCPNRSGGCSDRPSVARIIRLRWTDWF